MSGEVKSFVMCPHNGNADALQARSHLKDVFVKIDVTLSYLRKVAASPLSALYLIMDFRAGCIELLSSIELTAGQRGQVRKHNPRDKPAKLGLPPSSTSNALPVTTGAKIV